LEFWPAQNLKKQFPQNNYVMPFWSGDRCFLHFSEVKSLDDASIGLDS